MLLRTINFQVDPPDPYRLLLNYARSLRLGRAATRTAWGLVNDVLFCPRALSAPPPAVACAAIRMATRIHGSERRLRWFSPPRRKSGGGNKRRRGPTGHGDIVDMSGVSGSGNDRSGGEDVRQGLVVVGGGDDPNGNGSTPSANNGSSTDGGGGGGGGAETEPEKSVTPARVETAGVKTRLPSEPEPELEAVRDGGSGASNANEAGISTTELNVADSIVVAASGSPSCAVTDLSDAAAVGGSAGGVRGNSDNGHIAAENTMMPWWVLFDARDEEVELVCSELLALYRAQGWGGVRDEYGAAVSLVVTSSQSESVVGDRGPPEAAAVDVADSSYDANLAR